VKISREKRKLAAKRENLSQNATISRKKRKFVAKREKNSPN
jgi:hypothetical protein